LLVNLTSFFETTDLAKKKFGFGQIANSAVKPTSSLQAVSDPALIAEPGW
jgi:hypothetical protein